MGQNNSKSINSLVQKINDNSLKKVDLYLEFLNLGDDFQCDSDFYTIKKLADDINQVTFLFNFLTSTLSRILQ
ncbi:HID1 domain-containing protein, putative, partial [Hepatocystis sp. ex Piliocolobus tephrosceles]